MTRRPRVQFEGAFYHIIIARGNQRQDIFGDESDRHRHLERLRIYKEKRGFLLYGYVLMSNHVHLLIITPADPTSRRDRELLKNPTSAVQHRLSKSDLSGAF